jgi:hypothetical protein
VFHDWNVACRLSHFNEQAVIPIHRIPSPAAP